MSFSNEEWRRQLLLNTPEDNPFLALLESSDYVSSLKISCLAEKVFAISLSGSKRKPDIVYMNNDEAKETFESLQVEVEKRLAMTKEDLESRLLRHDTDCHAIETRPLYYLANCYLRCMTHFSDYQELDKVKSMIAQQTGITLQVSLSNNGHIDLLSVLKANTSKYLSHWLEDTYKYFESKGIACVAIMKKLVDKILSVIKASVDELPLLSINEPFFEPLIVLAKTPCLAKLFMLHNSLPENAHPQAYMETLIGSILRKSCLVEKMVHFIDEPSKKPESWVVSLENQIQASLEIIQHVCHQLFRLLLKAEDGVKHSLLRWVGNCLRAHKGLGWNDKEQLDKATGFLLNLSGVLLRLVQPICRGVDNTNHLKVDPTYTCAKTQQSVHYDCSQESFLIPSTEDKQRLASEDFNFSTDIFFLTHKCWDVFLTGLINDYDKLSLDVERKAKSFNALLKSDSTISQDVLKGMRRNIDILMAPQLCMRSALFVPSFIDNAVVFCCKSASWMVQLALTAHQPRLTSQVKPFTILASSIPSPGLQFVPDFVVQNISDVFKLLSIFRSASIEKNGEYLPMILEFVLTFMASPERMSSPHLRSKLATCLQSIMPIHRWSFDGSFFRVQLFSSHPQRLELITVLLKHFVDIEPRSHHQNAEDIGDALKYGCRSPIYAILAYLLESEEYVEKLTELATFAEAHIDDEPSPLYLKFLNFFINDAIFLVDDSIETSTTKVGNDDFASNNLLLHESQEQVIGQERLEGWARGCNRMSLQTCQFWSLLSGKVEHVITHSTMIDRLASTLNHFLLSLVGPKSTVDFSRKSFYDKYNFKPEELLKHVCQVYVNLKECQAFLKAIPRDARSYRGDLFQRAYDGLLQTGQSQLYADVKELEKSVLDISAHQANDESLFADAPDEFLDAILTHLMSDPVRLPHSQQVVDRSTIMRHLLSDPTDPFTRDQLTMDQLQPMEELKGRIEAWKNEKRRLAH